MKRIKEFLKKNKTLIIQSIIILLIFVAISVAAVLLFIASGIIYFDDNMDMQFNAAIFNALTNSWYGYLLFLGLQIIFTTVLCFIPGTSMTFIVLSQTIFQEAWMAFLIAFIGVILSSLIMYLVGRIGGYNICRKMVGEEDCEKASNLLNHKGAVFFPLMMLFPAFPDDALVMIAGTLKMDLKWFVPSIVVCRGIGIATIVFGLELVPFHLFTSPLHWVVFIAVCVVGAAAIFYCAYRFNKYLENRNKAK